MSDNPDYTADELLDWLCWMWAKDGERFYPPDETAEECVDNLMGGDENAIERDMLYQREYGEHCHAYDEARSKFRDLERRGFDPVERAAREHRELMKRAKSKLEPIDWSWYQER